MSKKFLIIGATGAVGSSLVKLIKDDDRLANEAHLVGKNEDEVSKLSEETGFNYTIADVIQSDFLEKLEEDLKDVEIHGIAYCVGSIDLKPIKNVTEKDFHKCMKLNLYSAEQSRLRLDFSPGTHVNIKTQIRPHAILTECVFQNYWKLLW